LFLSLIYRRLSTQIKNEHFFYFGFLFEIEVTFINSTKLDAIMSFRFFCQTNEKKV